VALMRKYEYKDEGKDETKGAGAFAEAIHASW
jgi:hypothetical protein